MRDRAVVHIITGLGVGGAERAVVDLSRALMELGWNASILSLNACTGVLPENETGDLTILSLNLRPSLLDAFRKLPRFVVAMRSIRPTVVHAHMFHAVWPALLWKLMHPRTQLVFTSHNAWHSPVRSALLSLTRRWRNCDVVFDAQQHRAMNATCVRVIPNGTRLREAGNRQTPQCSPWIAISVGRLTAAKNPLALIEQFAKLRSRDWQLWLVGEGELRPQIERRVTALNLDEHVKLLGMRRDVDELLNKAHVFVLGSLWEGMPLAIIEAGATGLPVLATPVGSIPQMLEGGCGYLVGIQEFPETLESIFADYAEALRRGARLRDKTASTYSIESTARAHAELYESLSEKVRNSRHPR